MTEPQYQVVAPVGRWAAASIEPAPEPGPVRRVGFVWDHVFRGDEMFRVLEPALSQSHPQLAFVGYEAFGDIHGAHEARVVGELPERLRAEDVDAVIVGVGA